MTIVPATFTYVSVVTHETVCISLLLAALNLLEVMTADSMSADITAPCKEKYETCLVLSLEKTKARKPLLLRPSTA